MISWIENALLSNLPGYSVMEGMGESAINCLRRLGVGANAMLKGSL